MTCTATGVYRIEIPGWHPAPLNRLMQSRWAAAKLKGVDRRRIQVAQWVYRVPPARGRRRVSLTIVLGRGQRAMDPDAYWKSLLDAAVHAGWLRDDRRQCVELGPVRFERADHPATVIELEDVP